MQDNYGTGDVDPSATAGTIAEFVLREQRIVGEIAYHGPNRRVIDLLNVTERAYMSLKNVVVDDLRRSADGEDAREPRRFKIMSLRRQSVLYAIPPWLRPPRSAGEVLQKIPVPATLIIPGYEITGKAYVPPGADVTIAPYVEHRPFVALTDATIVSLSDRDEVRVEPVVVANLGQASLYAPAGT